MTKDELQIIIDQLESGNLKCDAQFGILEDRGSSHDSYIKANKEGLELFAAELLKASRDADAILASKENSGYAMGWREEWIDGASTTFVQYIELLNEKEISSTITPHTETIKDQIMKVGCLAMLVVFVVAIVTGFATMVSWFF